MIIMHTYVCPLTLYTFMGTGADPLSCMRHAALLSCVLIYAYAFLY